MPRRAPGTRPRPPAAWRPATFNGLEAPRERDDRAAIVVKPRRPRAPPASDLLAWTSTQLSADPRRFDDTHAARERALPAARRSIRACANAIRAIHRCEFEPRSP